MLLPLVLQWRSVAWLLFPVLLSWLFLTGTGLRCEVGCALCSSVLCCCKRECMWNITSFTRWGVRGKPTCVTMLRPGSSTPCVRPPALNSTRPPRSTPPPPSAFTAFPSTPRTEPCRPDSNSAFRCCCCCCCCWRWWCCCSCCFRPGGIMELSWCIQTGSACWWWCCLWWWWWWCCCCCCCWRLCSCRSCCCCCCPCCTLDLPWCINTASLSCC
ncbi:hypothetical protein DUNSADRAFT_13782 [Dunaliella salina]|uniref:Uncharacterized protein n=1 Tax=Dunaliella salina TaxID=3046 RepID=A0ABQ7G8N5_DUNSA|nr:hypothetical protein DUNSADRAFT_13782 [Dunaliella salina]|eukprot:KAF5830972.1 hypothetical protein DUNSADRAFT_13782 [Dunaliella salina]